MVGLSVFVCCCFTSKQHLRSYQNGYRPVTVRIHGDFYSAAPLGDQAPITMICYPTQSHYSDTEPTSPCPIIIMPSTWLGSDKFQFYKFDSTRFWIFEVRRSENPKLGDGCSTHLAIPSGLHGWALNNSKRTCCLKLYRLWPVTFDHNNWV